MVSPTISLGSLGGGSSFMPPRRRRSASEMLEELKRRRRESMAREGATAAEEGVAGTVTAQSQYNPRPPSPVATPGAIPTPTPRTASSTRVSGPSALPIPVPQEQGLDYERLTRGPGFLPKSQELFFDIPKALFQSIPTSSRDDELWVGPMNEDERASFSKAVRLIGGQVSGSLDQLQKASVVTGLIPAAAASTIPGYDKIPKAPYAYSESATDRAKEALAYANDMRNFESESAAWSNLLTE